MKKLTFFLTFTLIGSFTFANNSPSESGAAFGNIQVILNNNQSDTDLTLDDDMYCSVKVGNVEMSCWFCDCDQLAKNARLANLGQ